jgi:hypothetical protein
VAAGRQPAAPLQPGLLLESFVCTELPSAVHGAVLCTLLGWLRRHVAEQCARRFQPLRSILTEIHLCLTVLVTKVSP